MYSRSEFPEVAPSEWRLVVDSCNCDIVHFGSVSEVTKLLKKKNCCLFFCDIFWLWPQHTKHNTQLSTFFSSLTHVKTFHFRYPVDDGPCWMWITSIVWCSCDWKSINSVFEFTVHFFRRWKWWNELNRVTNRELLEINFRERGKGKRSERVSQASRMRLLSRYANSNVETWTRRQRNTL